ncbi:hypothetical protein NDU88_004199 [Pleurodeles waltl]|uniref:Uncharacterized protein n=1 Tax=Pleurodeles waltl TaxID=8319 RepID=A0AAV7MFY1_PLEWA|nr:hypothetical protein NDU88_004199 [Pleurodeles waltl]
MVPRRRITQEANAEAGHQSKEDTGGWRFRLLMYGRFSVSVEVLGVEAAWRMTARRCIPQENDAEEGWRSKEEKPVARLQEAGDSDKEKR